jgi:hypothetical protein
MWSNSQYFFTGYFGCTLPVSQRIAVPPRCFQSVSLSQLISEVHADDERIVFVSFCELLAALEKFVLWKLVAPPKTVSVIVGTAPHRCACVIIQNYHKTDIGEGFNGDIENLQRGFADEFWIGFEVLGLYHFIVEEELKGVAKANAVHLEFVADVHGDVPHRPHF